MLGTLMGDDCEADLQVRCNKYIGCNCIAEQSRVTWKYLTMGPARST
jgi:hypothetical protein